VSGGAVGISTLNYYIDDRLAFQSELDWLIQDQSDVVVVSMNMRELESILAHPSLQGQVREFGFRSWPHLLGHLWDLLFEPSAFLRMRLMQAWSELALSGPAPWWPFRHPLIGIGFIGIHFRAGNESARAWWDPGRHPLSSLTSFLDCAALVERELDLPIDTKWFLSADTHEALATEATTELLRSGKLVALGDTWQLAHVDRSQVDVGLRGFSDAYVAYYLLASARAVVLSRSYFGETAAELGLVPNAFFAEGCVRTLLSAS